MNSQELTMKYTSKVNMPILEGKEFVSDIPTIESLNDIVKTISELTENLKNMYDRNYNA
jgi:hypothetical protein